MKSKAILHNLRFLIILFGLLAVTTGLSVVNAPAAAAHSIPEFHPHETPPADGDLDPTVDPDNPYLDPDHSMTDHREDMSKPALLSSVDISAISGKSACELDTFQEILTQGGLDPQDAALRYIIPYVEMDYYWGGTGITTGKIRTRRIPGLGVSDAVETLIMRPDGTVQPVWIAFWITGDDDRQQSAITGIFSLSGILSSPENSSLPFHDREDALSIFSSPRWVYVTSIPGLHNNPQGILWDQCRSVPEDACRTARLMENGLLPGSLYLINNQTIPDEWTLYGWNFDLYPAQIVLPDDSHLLECK